MIPPSTQRLLDLLDTPPLVTPPPQAAQPERESAGAWTASTHGSQEQPPILDPNKGFRKWSETGGFTTELLPIIPPNAPLAGNTKVQPENRGKVPGKRNSDGTWNGFKSWPKHQATVADCKQWTIWGASGGLQGRLYLGLDIDVEDEETAAYAEQLAIRCFGPAPVRIRAGSARRLLLYRQPKDRPPIGKKRLEWTDMQGQKHALELLGAGCQYLVFGTHKSGVEYAWRDGKSPCEWGRDSLNEALGAAEYFAELSQHVKANGGTIGKGSQAAVESTRALRKGLDEPSHWCSGGPEMVMRSLQFFKNTDETNPSRDDAVASMHAIKAALGPRREEFKADVVDWLGEYGWDDPDEPEKIWDSIRDSSLGWSWLSGKARAAGFDEEVQADFDDVPADMCGGTSPWERELAVPSGAPPLAKHPPFFRADKLDGLPKPHDFVEGLLCDGQCSVIYGDANVGKSFFTLDLAYHVALGWKWRGLDVDQGAVVYIAGEGGAGMRRRVDAFREEHGIEETAIAPLIIVPVAINFRDDKEIAGLIELVRRVTEQEGIPVRWVIVDTLSRALAGGNENAPDDMGALVRGADRVRTATGCHLTLIPPLGQERREGRPRA
jgi:hypothetical protein